MRDVVVLWCCSPCVGRIYLGSTPISGRAGGVKRLKSFFWWEIPTLHIDLDFSGLSFIFFPSPTTSNH